jgi:tetratricopeptide (TPR) repeat protein
VLDATCLAAGIGTVDGFGALLGLHLVLAIAYGFAIAIAARSGAFGILSGLFAALVPIAGPLGLLAARGAHSPRAPEVAGVEVLAADGGPLPMRPGRRAPIAASLRATLRLRTEASAQRRFRALLELGDLPPRRAVALLKLALTDPDDEVRLFAFSRIDRWRSDLERSIDALSSALARAKDPRAARLHLAIAQLHWETAYLGLVEGAAREDALRRALEHGDAARHSPRDAGPREFLRGRVLLQLRDPGAARAAFEAAAAYDYPRFRVAPYLAECAFLERDFERVRAALHELGRAPSVPMALGPISELWS